MARERVLPAAFIVIPAILIVITGCSPGERPVAPEGALTGVSAAVDPEQCVEAILESYGDHGDPGALAKYAGALHPDYRFYFQPGDAAPGKRPFLDREEDIAVTGRIFARATILMLDISPGAWHQLCDYDGMPCEGCLTSTREYFIMAQFGADTKIHRGTDIVVIIAVPDPDFPDRYVILAIYDVDDGH